jgi:hypothetical protein
MVIQSLFCQINLSFPLAEQAAKARGGKMGFLPARPKKVIFYTSVHLVGLQLIGIRALRQTPPEMSIAAG